MTREEAVKVITAPFPSFYADEDECQAHVKLFNKAMLVLKEDSEYGPPRS